MARFAYFARFFDSASAAAAPDSKADLWTYEDSRVSGQVASQRRHLPLTQGTRVAPSGQLGVDARQTRRLTDGGNVSALQCSEDCIIEQVVAEVATGAALAGQSVVAELVHRYHTAALVLQHQWRAESQSYGHPQRAVVQIETKGRAGHGIEPCH